MLKRLFSGASRALKTAEELILAWAMLAIAGLTILNALSRTFLHYPLAFAEELTAFLVILVCFVGLSYAASQGRHIRMTAIYDQLPPRGRKALMVTICGFTAALMFLFTYYALVYVDVVRELGTVSPTLRIPVFLVYLVVPLGFTLAGIQYTLAVVKNLVEPDIYLAFGKKDEYEEPDKCGV